MTPTTSSRAHSIDEGEPFILKAEKAVSSERRRCNLALLAIYAGVFLNGLLLLLNVTLWKNTLSAGVWSTDLKDARSAIEYEEKVFTGALLYDQTQGKSIRRMDSDVEYFGPPSPEIDQAWKDLLHGEFVIMTPEEALPFGDELLPYHNGEYYFE
ncbi:unnamed protein product [Zymoseptoria tritici ST99CH_3D1]|nr:unnamed protein product [Zymoseptoria tritici ST99CH_3D1]